MPPNKSDVAAVLETSENKVRIDRYEKMAAQEQANFDVAAKLFDPAQLMRRATQIREYSNPQLGTIRFVELTMVDAEIIRQCTSDADKTAIAVYLMLKKAYPEMPPYTPENIGGFYRAFPVIEGAALLQFISEFPVFLQKNSATRSEAVDKPEKLA